MKVSSICLIFTVWSTKEWKEKKDTFYVFFIFKAKKIQWNFWIYQTWLKKSDIWANIEQRCNNLNTEIRKLLFSLILSTSELNCEWCIELCGDWKWLFYWFNQFLNKSSKKLAKMSRYWSNIYMLKLLMKAIWKIIQVQRMCLKLEFMLCIILKSSLMSHLIHDLIKRVFFEHFLSYWYYQTSYFQCVWN